MVRVLSKNKKRNLSVDIHPSAVDAFNFCTKQSFCFDKTLFKPNSLSLLDSTQIYRAILTSKNQCLLFSGFETIGFSLNNFDATTSEVLIYEKLTDKEIEQKAWLSVLRVMFSSIKGKHLESFRNTLNSYAPNDLVCSLFSSNKLTQKQLATLSNMAVSGIKKQKPSPTSNVQDNHRVDIFKQIIEAQKHE
ncbi:hypothetical protein [Vibrio marisflavi]|uniref:Uncharacterized protein n=1 Tax=Vibrio marisflavi CECT 7928 TaxID=634439 RepID=A0ABN8DYF6_9VIBR|nr:hypothetical protein [Vibrio marisflavi]CAH0536634.1 hypothetical protein VMF7928_00588 [Vibrio marisflavi CECT 7928]